MSSGFRQFSISKIVCTFFESKYAKVKLGIRVVRLTQIIIVNCKQKTKPQYYASLNRIHSPNTICTYIMKPRDNFGFRSRICPYDTVKIYINAFSNVRSNQRFSHTNNHFWWICKRIYHNIMYIKGNITLLTNVSYLLPLACQLVKKKSQFSISERAINYNSKNQFNYYPIDFFFYKNAVFCEQVFFSLHPK